MLAVRQRSQTRTGGLLRALPFMIVPIAAYLLIAWIDHALLGKTIFNAGMPSNGVWSFTVADLLTVVALFALFVEVLKATYTGRSTVMDHALSTVAFVIALICFLLIPEAASSTFFAILVMCAIDVIGGFSVGITAARRDIDVDS